MQPLGQLAETAGGLFGMNNPFSAALRGAAGGSTRPSAPPAPAPPPPEPTPAADVGDEPPLRHASAPRRRSRRRRRPPRRQAARRRRPRRRSRRRRSPAPRAVALSGSLKSVSRRNGAHRLPTSRGLLALGDERRRDDACRRACCRGRRSSTSVSTAVSGGRNASAMPCSSIGE